MTDKPMTVGDVRSAIKDLPQHDIEMTIDRWYDAIKLFTGKDKQSLQKINYENLTWKCEVCRKVRHDSKIDVMQHPYNFGEIKVHHNIKYCNDKPYCKEMAESHNLYELRKMRND